MLNGGLGADTLIGSEGDDLINGGDGNDVALMGAGNDTFVWNPGDDNDTLEGQAGQDTMLFNGAGSGRTSTYPPMARVRFTRDIANVTMDLYEVQRIGFNALGGADTINVHDLSGTDATKLDRDRGLWRRGRRTARHRHRRHQRRDVIRSHRVQRLDRISGSAADLS